MEAVFTQSRLYNFSPEFFWKNTTSAVTSVRAFWRKAFSGRRTAPRKSAYCEICSRTVESAESMK